MAGNAGKYLLCINEVAKEVASHPILLHRLDQSLIKV